MGGINPDHAVVLIVIVAIVAMGLIVWWYASGHQDTDELEDHEDQDHRGPSGPRGGRHRRIPDRRR